MSTIMRNPRSVVPASRRIHNWRTLPVEGCRAWRGRAWPAEIRALLWGALAALLVLWLFAVKP